MSALDARFRAALAAEDPSLSARFEAYRAGAELRPPEESELLIAAARPLSAFVARLFRVESGRQALIDFATREQAVFRLKEFVARRAGKKYPAGSIAGADAESLHAQVLGFAERALPELVVAGDAELTLGRALSALLDIEDPLRKVAEGQTTDPVPPAVAARLAEICARLPDPPAPDLVAVRAMLDVFERWASVHRFAAEGHAAVAGWVSFHFPHHIDHEHLVPLRRPDPTLPNIADGLPEKRRHARIGQLETVAPDPERGRLLPLLPRPREGLVLDRLA